MGHERTNRGGREENAGRQPAKWLDELVMSRTWSVVVLGGGPGGYEAALVAARLGASVTVVDRDGVGGSCVLTDCVPSKSLISTAHVLRRMGAAREHGIDLTQRPRCLLYTSPSPRDRTRSRMPSSA